MTYEDLLLNAPDHNSDAFIDYLREHNKVVFENPQWIVIENFKYHKKLKPWYTAFHKPREFWPGSDAKVEWWQDIDILHYQRDWKDWEWLKKAATEQTVKRFHIHIHK